MTSKLKEGVMQGVFTLCACVSILAVALICIFLFANGVPTLFKIGPLKFLLGTTWKPGNDIFGILPMILGSIYVTAGAILVGVPIGLLTAIYMSKFASPRINKVMLPAVQLLAGIPSVVYGFFGMIVLVPAVQAMVKSPFFKTVLHVKSGKGMSLFTAAVLLGIMILPTIITVSKTSLDAVPDSYYEGSLALGATHERSVFYAVLPAAKSGVLSAVILGIGRAIGETMAVVMVAGNQTWMPKGLFQGLRTMTSNIVIEMGYAADQNQPGATFRQCRRVIIGRCAQSADRPDGLSVGRHVFRGVRTRTARHDARTKGRGEERRLPVCKFVEQDEYDLFFHNLIYKSVSTCRRIPLRRLRSAARRSANAPWRRPVPSCPRRRASENFFRRRACSPRCSRSKWRAGR
mgnify:CR=1 FL=1